MIDASVSQALNPPKIPSKDQNKSTPTTTVSPKKSKDKILTCIKGKSSLKVIGKSPKCPAGYKVKK
jgi:hypothetical protein